MSNTKTVLGFVAGAAVGAIVGILLAPDKGSETRSLIKGKAGDISDSIKKAFTDFVDDVKTTYTNTKEEADELSQKAKSTLDSLQKSNSEATYSLIITQPAGLNFSLMNSVIDNIEQIAAAASSVAETKFELFKLKTAGKVSASLSTVIIIFVVALFGSIALIILSFGLAYFIGSKLGDVSYGFFIIGGVFALAGFLVYANRKSWVQTPLTNIFIDKLVK